MIKRKKEESQSYPPHSRILSAVISECGKTNKALIERRTLSPIRQPNGRGLIAQIPGAVNDWRKLSLDLRQPN